MELNLVFLYFETKKNRAVHTDIINVDYDTKNIAAALALIDTHQITPLDTDFGQGNCAQLFLESIEKESLWAINHQK